MLSRAIVPYHLRFYSAPRKTLKLWVKHSGTPSFKVPVKGCECVDDFAEEVKRELNIKDRVALFTSLNKEALDPGLSVKDLLKTDLKSNSGETPLFAKIFPASQARKTIYIGVTDRGEHFTREYMRITIRKDQDLQRLVNNSEGLVSLSSPDHVLTHFDEIKDGERYHYYEIGREFKSWLKTKAEGMEAEILLLMKTYLEKSRGEWVVNLPNDIYDSKGKKIEEWDGVISSKDTLYLLEVEHSMSVEKIKEMAKRVKNFPKIMEQSSKKELKKKYSKIVGVAYGTHFPDESREEARRMGLVVVYPSDGRYLIKSN